MGSASLIILGETSGLALLAALARGEDPPGQSSTPPFDLTSGWAASCVLGAMLIRTAILFIMARLGMTIFEMDEAARWALAKQWADRPFFFSSWDGIWLSGGFAYFGAWMKLTGDPQIGALAGGLAGNWLTIFAAFDLGRVVSRRNWIGVLAAWLVACGFPFLIVGHGCLTESVLAGFFMLGYSMGLRFLRGESGGVFRFLLAAGCGASLFLTNSLHYLGWSAVAAAAPPFLAAIWRKREGLGGWGLAGFICIALGSILFQIFWMLGSWKYLGSPLAFLRNQSSAAAAGLEKTRLGMNLGIAFSTYPRLLLSELWPLLPLTGLSILAFWRRSIGIAGVALVIYAAFLLLVMGGTAALGGYAAPFHRYATIPYALILVFLAGSSAPLEKIWMQGRRRTRLISRILLAGLIASWGMLNFGMARDYAAASPASQWPNDVKALAAWLQHEFRSPQTLTGLTTDKPIGVYEEWNLAQWSDFLSLMSDGRNRFTLLKKEDISGEAAQALQHEYLIVRGIGEINGYNYTTQVGTWIVFRRRE